MGQQGLAPEPARGRRIGQALQYNQASRATDPCRTSIDRVASSIEQMDTVSQGRHWELPFSADRPSRLGKRPLVMGVVNLTPDSFSDGGQFSAPAEAVEHALAMARDGAGWRRLARPRR